MIAKGEHPPKDTESEGLNKFLGLTGEGHRGLLVARSKNGRCGIIVSMTQSLKLEDGVEWGRLYEVVEGDPGEWPSVVRAMDRVPAELDWEILR